MKKKIKTDKNGLALQGYDTVAKRIHKLSAREMATN